jgi:hypothetical protein
MVRCGVSSTLVKVLFWIYLLFLLVVSGTQTNPADPDLWHRLAVGEFLWQTHTFPLGDTFSYLPDYQTIADHEWGSALVFYGLWQWGGPTAIVVTKLVTLALTLGLVIWAGIGSRRPTVGMAAFYGLILLALLPSFQSTVRCMVFTHIFFALWICWYQRERRGRHVATWLYAVTMVVWANLHGGFVIGLFWLLLLAVLEAWEGGDWRRWARRFALCLAATLVNPFGWGLWISTSRALVISRHGFGEWAAVSWIAEPGAYPGYKLLLVFVIVVLAVQLYRKGWKRIDQAALVFIVVFMLLAIDSARHTSLFAVVAGAFLPGLFPFRWPHFFDRGPVRRLGMAAVNSALIIFPLVAALRVIGDGRLALEYPPIDCPVYAVQFLQSEKIRGNLLVPFNYGSYALWELRGKMRVSLDGRYDLVYKPETYERVEDFFAAKKGWYAMLAHPRPDAVLVPRDRDVYYKLHADPDWKEAWHDPYNAVFLPK